MDNTTGVSGLKLNWIDDTTAIQRKGRVGRTDDGLCIRLYPKNKPRQYNAPELMRINLEPLFVKVLNMSSLPLGKVIL